MKSLPWVVALSQVMALVMHWLRPDGFYLLYIPGLDLAGHCALLAVAIVVMFAESDR